MPGKLVEITTAESSTIRNQNNTTKFSVSFVVNLGPNESLRKIGVTHSSSVVTFEYEVIAGSLTNSVYNDQYIDGTYIRTSRSNHETIVKIRYRVNGNDELDSESMSTVNLDDNKKINFFI